MRISLVTLFPEWFESPLRTALLGRARASGLVTFDLLNPRNAASDRHRTVDDRPYGGGPGMVMLLEPLVRTLRGLEAGGELGRTLLLSASGRPFTQAFAAELAREERLTLICGRYEGIDARLERLFPLEPVSVGEAVINGGEAAAMLIVEAVTRLVPGFMGKEESGEEESFSAGVLEYPHFTRPESFEGLCVPEVLLSGDHGRIARWRREQSLVITRTRRPEMLCEAPLDRADMSFLRGMPRERPGRNLSCCLLHYPVCLENGRIGASSLTNLDVHDIARCSRTYGLARFLVATPFSDQRAVLQTLVDHWTVGPGGAANPDRAEAFQLVRCVDSVEAAVEHITALTGQRPFLLGTSARAEGGLTPGTVRQLLRQGPVLLLFGTAHGLAPDVLEKCDGILRPLRWMDSYNHFPVRGAAAVALDRLLGDID